MRASLIAAACIALAPRAATAQSGLLVGVGLTLNAPAGELADGWETGFGAALTAEFEVDPRWTFAGTLGVSRFPGKTISVPGIEGQAPDLDSWGISAGARSYLGGGTAAYGGLYVASELGYFRFTHRGESTSERQRETEIGVLPTIGYRAGSFDISTQIKLGGRYQWLQFRGSINLLRM